MTAPGGAPEERVTVLVDAPAKVNLLLRVLHRRPDGYRELETLFQAISLVDTVEVTLDRAAADGISLHVRGADVGPAEDNLAWRAALAFREATALSGAIHIDLVKRIPAGAGLGGGSSDAAAVLRSLAAIVQGGREPAGPTGGGAAGLLDAASLRSIGAALGSDVPFFLGGSPLALARGRGEVLTSLTPLPEAALVLALPPVHVSTAEAYRALGEVRGGGAAGSTTDPPPPRPEAGLRVTDWRSVEELAENDFESVVVPAHAEIVRSLDGLRAEGARFALLSGSGGASFGYFDSIEAAGRAAVRLQTRLGWPFVAVRTLERLPSPAWCH